MSSSSSPIYYMEKNNEEKKIPYKEVEALPTIGVFDRDEIVLRKGGMIFGKSKPTIIPLHVKKLAFLEIYMKNECENYLIPTKDIDYYPIPIIPHKSNRNESVLYLHNKITKNSSSSKKLSDLKFIALYMENEQPIAKTNEFYFISRGNVKISKQRKERKKNLQSTLSKEKTYVLSEQSTNVHQPEGLSEDSSTEESSIEY